MSPTDKVNNSEAGPLEISALQTNEQGLNNASTGALGIVGKLSPHEQSTQEEAGAEPVMKARAAMAHAPSTPHMGQQMGAQSMESEEFSSETAAIGRSERAAKDSPPTPQSGGSEKLRAEIIAKAREAESRAREAEEKYKQAEARFKQEQALRQLAERRAEEIEEEYGQRLATAEAEGFSRLELELALAEADALYKQEAEARLQSETTLAQARKDAQFAASALDEAEKRIALLEINARELEERTLTAETAAREVALLGLELVEAETRISELQANARDIAEVSAVAETSAREAESLRLSMLGAEKRITELESGVQTLEEKAVALDGARLEVEELGLSLQGARNRVAELEVSVRDLEEKAVALEDSRRETDELKLALHGAENRITELEGGAQEAEEKTLAAERAMREAHVLTIALEDAERRIAEMQAEVQDVEIKGIAAEETAQAMESRLHILESQMKAADEKRKAAEARLQLEIEGRSVAEIKAQTLETEFKTDLELDWARFEADIEKAEAAVKAREDNIARTSAEQARRESEEQIQRLCAQIEEEQQARMDLEKRLTEAETKSGKSKSRFNSRPFRKSTETDSKFMEATDSKVAVDEDLTEIERGKSEGITEANEKTEFNLTNAQAAEIEDQAKEAVMQKPSRSMSGNSSLLTLGLSNEAYSLPTENPASRNDQIKLLGYGAAISMLLAILIFLGLMAFRLM